MGGEILGIWVQDFSVTAARWISIAFVGFYLLFSLIFIRQTRLLNAQLKTRLATPIEVFSWVHFLLALAAFAFTLFYWQNYGKGFGF